MAGLSGAANRRRAWSSSRRSCWLSRSSCASRCAGWQHAQQKVHSLCYSCAKPVVCSGMPLALPPTSRAALSNSGHSLALRRLQRSSRCCCALPLLVVRETRHLRLYMACRAQQGVRTSCLEAHKPLPAAQDVPVILRGSVPCATASPIPATAFCVAWKLSLRPLPRPPRPPAHDMLKVDDCLSQGLHFRSHKAWAQHHQSAAAGVWQPRCALPLQLRVPRTDAPAQMSAGPGQGTRNPGNQPNSPFDSF